MNVLPHDFIIIRFSQKAKNILVQLYQCLLCLDMKSYSFLLSRSTSLHIFADVQTDSIKSELVIEPGPVVQLEELPEEEVARYNFADGPNDEEPMR